MAEELPALMDFPEEAVTGAGLQQSRNQANWGRTFGPSDSMPMQRLRHNQDIAGYIEQSNLKRSQDVQLERETSKKAFDLFAAEKRLGMDSEKTKAELRIKEQKLLHDEEMQPKKIAATEAATAAALARETATTEGTRLKARVEERLFQHTTGFQTEVGTAMDNGAEIGSREYLEAVTKARIKYPGADKAYADDIWKSTGSEMSFDDAVKQHQAGLAAAGPNTTVTTKLPGGGSMTDRPVNEEAGLRQDRAFADKQLSRALTQKSKAIGVDAVKEADAHVQEVQARLSEIDNDIKASRGTPGAASAPAPDVNKAAMDWVTANPNDPRAAAIKAKLGMK